jgi:ectoine hydroxylase-related dioxygenase (phytanoyl-CoA dioxygenase family)
MAPSRWISVSLLCLAMLFPAVVADTTTIRNADKAPSFFTPEQHVAYDRDGYLVVSNIFSETDLRRLLEAGDALAANQTNPYFFSVQTPGALFQDPPDHADADADSDSDSDKEESASTGASCKASTSESSSSSDTPNTNTNTNAFRQIAVHSVLGQASAELMQLDADNKDQNLRILRDVFLAKPVHSTAECDWHVDDQMFWPESFCSDTKTTTTKTTTTKTKTTTTEEDDDDEDDSSSEQDSRTACANGPSDTGVNVWIAMDDMPVGRLGSMALSPGSHKAAWRHDAYKAIGQDRNQTGGLKNMQALVDLFTDPDNKSTCSMPKSDPALRSRIEDTAVFLDMRAGDVIFTHRLLFHRTLAVTDAGKEMYDAENKTNLNRYSVRYVPGTARLPTGYSFEWSVLENPDHRGRTLNEVAHANTTGQGQDWYPQVWPTIDPDLDAKLHDMETGPRVGAKEKADVKMQEFRQAMKARSEEIAKATKGTNEAVN